MSCSNQKMLAQQLAAHQWAEALGSSRVTVASPLSTAAGQFAPSRGNYQRRAGPPLGKGPYLG